jgi:hypothetical protein
LAELYLFHYQNPIFPAMLFREALDLYTTVGNKIKMAEIMIALSNIEYEKANYDEQKRLISNAVQIWRTHDLPIDQWYIDNGY